MWSTCKFRQRLGREEVHRKMIDIVRSADSENAVSWGDIDFAWDELITATLSSKLCSCAASFPAHITCSFHFVYLITRTVADHQVTAYQIIVGGKHRCTQNKRERKQDDRK
jgi:hypothetical protein